MWEEKVFEELGKPNIPYPQIVVFYLQPFEEKFYGSLKKILINKFGIVSQFIKAKTITGSRGGELSKASKIVIQMNQKVGNTVWKIFR
jgi:hypothetical protein